MTNFLAVFNQNTPPQQILSVLDTIRTTGGQLLNAWGHTVLLGEGSPATVAAVAASPGVAYATDSLIPPLPFANLDDVAMELGAAWAMSQSPFFQQIVDAFGDGDAGQALPPGGCNQAGGNGQAIFDNPFNIPSLLGISGGVSSPLVRVHPERRALVGTIGVAILQIDGPLGTDAAFTPAESSIAFASLGRAFDFLHTAAPRDAHLFFTTAIHKVRLGLNPAAVPIASNPNDPTTDDFLRLEAPWRDQALQALGMGTGREGFRALVSNSRFMFDVDWGFVLVLTKYRAAWPGYCPKFRDVVISYSGFADRGWLNTMHASIAHEIGHTTATDDEYGTCLMLQPTGFSGRPNLNCLNGNQFMSVPCLMRDLSPIVCEHTRSHFGWGDLNLNGIIDPYDASFVPL